MAVFVCRAQLLSEQGDCAFTRESWVLSVCALSFWCHLLPLANMMQETHSIPFLATGMCMDALAGVSWRELFNSLWSACAMNLGQMCLSFWLHIPVEIWGAERGQLNVDRAVFKRYLK